MNSLQTGPWILPHGFIRTRTTVSSAHNLLTCGWGALYPVHGQTSCRPSREQGMLTAATSPEVCTTGIVRSDSVSPSCSVSPRASSRHHRLDVTGSQPCSQPITAQHTPPPMNEENYPPTARGPTIGSADRFDSLKSGHNRPGGFLLFLSSASVCLLELPIFE